MEINVDTGAEFDNEVCESKKNLILASNGLMKETRNRKLESITVEKGETHQVVSRVEEYIKNISKPVVVLAVGNVDIRPKVYGVDEGLIKGREKSVHDDMVNEVMVPIYRLNSKIRARKGVLKVASVIPCPADQHYTPNANEHKLHLQAHNSSVYMTINDRITALNKRNRVSTPQISSFFEEKTLYKDRKQKKIHTNKFQKDGVTPTVRMTDKITRICETELKDKTWHNQLQSTVHKAR